MKNVRRFEQRDVEDMYETLKPLVRAREGLQVKYFGVALLLF